MKISKIEYKLLEFELTEPYTIAYETVTKAKNIILKITASNGKTGWGCAAPDTFITNETVNDVINTIENPIIDKLQDQNPYEFSRILTELKTEIPLKKSSLAMVDMALLDLVSKNAELPLYYFLGAHKNVIQTSITIGILPLEETLYKAKDFVAQGFKVIKLKGGLHVEEDIEKIKALRTDFGPQIALRFDANQGYNLQDSMHFVKGVKAYNVEIFEQPVNVAHREQMGLISQSSKLPIMADESLKSLTDAFKLAQDDLIDMVNIKLQKVGGILEAQHINSVAKAAKFETMVGCLDECALGISAGLHFALSKSNVYYADLDSHLDIVDDPFKGLFTLKDGNLYPSKQPGLGVMEEIF